MGEFTIAAEQLAEIDGEGADVFFETPRGQCKLSIGSVWAWMTWPDGTREKMTVEQAKKLALQMVEPN